MAWVRSLVPELTHAEGVDKKKKIKRIEKKQRKLVAREKKIPRDIKLKNRHP